MATGHHQHTVRATSEEELNRTEIFRRAWRVYQMVVDSDADGHAHASKVLGQMLDACDIGSLRFVDLACGDAGMTTKTLLAHRPRAYLGVDLSEDALAVAREHLGELEQVGVPIETRVGDFTSVEEVFRSDQGVASFGWIGLSLHHLEHERTVDVLSELREHLQGPLGLWEPMLLADDTHETWAERWQQAAAAKLGNRADAEDWVMMMDHIRNADLPRTIRTWEAEAREAGWAEFRFLDSTANQTLGMMLLQ